MAIGLKSVLSPPEAVAIGVGLGAVDVFIFSQHCASGVDIRTAMPQNDDADACRRQATALCIAINGLVSVMTRDWNVFLIGGIVTVGLSWLQVHANTVHPATGKMSAPGDATVQPDQDNATAYPIPDYGYTDDSQAA
jgi:hypothetical protein